jgi:hypothetical protein
MSQILRAPVSFLNAIIANPAALKLSYASGQVNATHDVLIASGAAVVPYINAPGQVLTGLPTYGALATNARAYRLQVPASQAIAASLGLERDIELGEFCELQASDPKDLLALGFTPYTPTNSAPIPSCYG